MFWTVRQKLDFLTWYKQSAPCADCDRYFPSECMDFAHVPERGAKVMSIPKMARLPVEVFWSEIAKCDVVCACCHRIRTRARKVQTWHKTPESKDRTKQSLKVYWDNASPEAKQERGARIWATRRARYGASGVGASNGNNATEYS